MSESECTHWRNGVMTMSGGQEIVLLPDGYSMLRKCPVRCGYCGAVMTEPEQPSVMGPRLRGWKPTT